MYQEPGGKVGDAVPVVLAMHGDVSPHSMKGISRDDAKMDQMTCLSDEPIRRVERVGKEYQVIQNVIMKEIGNISMIICVAVVSVVILGVLFIQICDFDNQDGVVICVGIILVKKQHQVVICVSIILGVLLLLDGAF